MIPRERLTGQNRVGGKERKNISPRSSFLSFSIAFKMAAAEPLSTPWRLHSQIDFFERPSRESEPKRRDVWNV